MPKLPTVTGELGASIRRARADGRLGPEHRLDVARARLLCSMLLDPETPRSSIAPLDRRLDVILGRLGLVVDATGPTELDEWLQGLADEELDPDALLELEEENETAGTRSAEDLGPE